jgi:putative transposase
MIYPTSYTAKNANEAWSWDISYLPSQVKGLYFYLYFFEDIYSRMIVGSEVYAQERGELAADLVERAVISQKCCGQPLVLHSDNGAPMKSSIFLLAKLYDLGITPSRGRPRVSNDNPYSESMCRTLEYCPQRPAKGFVNIEQVRIWVSEFVNWYNHEHRHSRIRFVTPAQRHQGMDIEILKRRSEVYQKAKENNPIRWSGKTRNWAHIDRVELNQENRTKIGS